MSDLLDYLFATPFTPSTPSDRSGDLLSWSRIRRRLQRRLFPPFTVLTPRRHSAEIRLLMEMIITSDDLPAPFKTMTNCRSRLKLMRHLEILFGLASLVNENVKDLPSLIEAAQENPCGILNIERIRQYLEHRKDSSSSFVCSESPDDYMANLAYGIGPHYTVCLREFDMMRKRGEFFDNEKFKTVLKKVANWGNQTRRSSFKSFLDDLKFLNNYSWKEIFKDFDSRTKFWISLLESSDKLKHSFLYQIYLHARSKLPENLPLDSADALRQRIYESVFASARGLDLYWCLVECRIFEVLTALADFLIYSLIAYATPQYEISEDAGGDSRAQRSRGKKLSTFIDNNISWLPGVTAHLYETIKQARFCKEKMADSCQIPELSFPDLRLDKGVFGRREIREVLLFILNRHARTKGSGMTFVNILEDDQDVVLIRTDRQQAGLDSAKKIQEALIQGDVRLPGLINLNADFVDFDQLFKNDSFWASFVANNFLWATFGRWFGFVKQKDDAYGD